LLRTRAATSPLPTALQHAGTPQPNATFFCDRDRLCYSLISEQLNSSRSQARCAAMGGHLVMYTDIVQQMMVEQVGGWLPRLLLWLWLATTWLLLAHGSLHVRMLLCC
jgi:hypothetical protein